MNILWTIIGALLGYGIAELPYKFVNQLGHIVPFLIRSDIFLKGWFVVAPLVAAAITRRSNKSLSNGFFISFVFTLLYTLWLIKRFGF